jgi:hypothetical protein
MWIKVDLESFAMTMGVECAVIGDRKVIGQDGNAGRVKLLVIYVAVSTKLKNDNSNLC